MTLPHILTNGKKPFTKPAIAQRVLILMARTGGGHVSLAEALRDRLQACPQITIAAPIPPAVNWHYRMVSRHARWLWSLEYRLTNDPTRAALVHRMNTLLFRRPVQQVLDETNPDLILTTYPFLTSEVQQILRQRGKQTPLILLFADPEQVHQAWLSARDAWGFAPTREIYRQAQAAGFAPKRLFLSGWPVREQFWDAATYDRAAVAAELELDPQQFTVLVQGGGEGAAGFVRTVDAVRAASQQAGVPVQIILAAGTNTALIERFRGMPGVRALPFTPHIGRYMAASDLVLGKAGPNTLMESVSLGVPFIATTYIPGQEESNLAFIVRYRLGDVALTAPAQHQLVLALLQEPRRLAGLRATVASYGAWNNQHVARIPAYAQEVYQCLPSPPKDAVRRLS